MEETGKQEIPSLERELAEALAIGWRASKLVSEIYETPFEVELKGPGDPVTRADREANELICKALTAAFPDDAILAEESVPTSVDEIRALVGHERVWFVDPLDGTREFASRNGEFAVMIGLAIKGRAALGVVVMPVLNEALAGGLGIDAFIEEKSGTRRALRVSSVSDSSDATLLVSRSHRAPKFLEPIIDALRITKVVPCGSVGVKVARIARGEGDLYIHGGGGAKRWDTCAPEAILAAAGGRFTDLGGQVIDYSDPELVQKTGILASNSALHTAALGALAKK